MPEDHGKPDGKPIDLAFAVLKAHTLSPVPDPVIYLHGGPGGGALTALAGVVQPLFEGYRSRRDVVTFEQRAAGISSDMVSCFNTLGGSIFELLVPSRFTEEKQMDAYNTYLNALDVQAVMLALRYP